MAHHNQQSIKWTFLKKKKEKKKEKKVDYKVEHKRCYMKSIFGGQNLGTVPQMLLLKFPS